MRQHDVFAPRWNLTPIAHPVDAATLDDLAAKWPAIRYSAPSLARASGWSITHLPKRR